MLVVLHCIHNKTDECLLTWMTVDGSGTVLCRHTHTQMADHEWFHVFDDSKADVTIMITRYTS